MFMFHWQPYISLWSNYVFYLELSKKVRETNMETNTSTSRPPRERILNLIPDLCMFETWLDIWPANEQRLLDHL